MALRLAERPCQPLRAAGSRDHPDADLRLAEDGVIGGHDHVAGHGQLAATAERVAADGRDDRLADAAQPLPAREAVGDRTG